MQSTSSSARWAPPKRSATEALAARYRHLFVLPRAEVLVLLTALASFLLSLEARGVAWPFAFVTSTAVAVLSSLVVSSALQVTDRATIANFRRANATLLASQALWLVCATIGLAYSVAIGSLRPLANAVLFGAFVSGGMEFLTISGAFTENIPLSASLAAVHPVSTFLIIGLPLTTSLSFAALGAGVITLVIIAAFTPLLGRGKTSRGYSTVRLFQAFMKTWTNRNATDLEVIISDHAQPSDVTTKVMRFRQDNDDIFVVLPGVHPGPFFPVGSYNLPGVISSEFKKTGHVITLHRPGGHERNLASNNLTRLYASQIHEFALNIKTSESGTIRGPAFTRIGKANVSSSAFSADLLLTISFAPLGSDDLEPRVEDELSRFASASGFTASIVDAHNSIAEGQEQPDLSDPGWNGLFELMKRSGAKPLRLAYSHSSETRFSAGDDVTEDGIGLLMLETDGAKSVLVLADANNTVPDLHEEAAKELESSGYRLLEFCTSDSHDLAAKGLTVTRGYKALGEATPTPAIRKLVVDLAKLAEERLAPCKYGSGEFTSSVMVFGSKALDEFASITQSSSRFAKRYAKMAVPTTLLLLVLSLML